MIIFVICQKLSTDLSRYKPTRRYVACPVGVVGIITSHEKKLMTFYIVALVVNHVSLPNLTV